MAKHAKQSTDLSRLERKQLEEEYIKVRIHGAILRAMAELHRVSTPKFVARNIFIFFIYFLFYFINLLLLLL